MKEGSCDFDVVVVGSGIGGSMAGTLLARKGHRVLLVDASEHPRFAIGESTIPHTSQLISILAAEHDVPELENLGLGSPGGLRSAVGNSCGVKRNFTFAYHRLDHSFDFRHGIQQGNVWRAENHFFRQDVDAYMFRTALGYGCQSLLRTRVEDFQFDSSSATLRLSGGKKVTARYVIDASGFRSKLAEVEGLREQPTTLQHHSRCIFTHMMNVKLFEECEPNPLSWRWSEGTLHHLFDRGWMWVIPFNNWEGSTNPLVSVGLTVDPRVYPTQEALSPEEEFTQFLERLPSAKKQFESAIAVRPWTRTGRLQYSSTRTVGPRYCLLSHAAGFVDPLYARGLINTVEVISNLVPRLDQALRDDDLSADRFSHVDYVHKRGLSYADRLIHGSYQSWRDFDVWNLWMRVWAIGTLEAEILLASRYRPEMKEISRSPNNPVFSEHEGLEYRTFFERCCRVIEKYARDEMSTKDTVQTLQKALDAYGIVLPMPDSCEGQDWAFKSPDCRDFFFGDPKLHARWVARETDPHLRVG